MNVVIDAGHGIETMGKRAFDNSFLEYEFNRKVAGKIKYHLERHHVKVTLTAPENTDVSLAERVALTNAIKPDCFISIHANAFGTDWNEANGWEIYVYQLNGPSETLAQHIAKESNPYLGLKYRGIKTADFYVLKHTNCPAVLVEHGFYTNKSELIKLKSKDFQDQCAIADSKGIIQFLGLSWQNDAPEEAKDIASPWAQEAQKWVKSLGISNGSYPKNYATREEVWLMLMNLYQQMNH